MKYFKIGEVSRIKNVTIKALRFYDRVGLLTPAMVDAYSGYRYYSADQLFQVEMIQYLRNLNIPIADMKYLFQHADLHTWNDFFDELQEMMIQKIADLNRARFKLSMFQKHIGSIEVIEGEVNFYLRHISRRLLLTMPCAAGPSTAEAVDKFQQLYQLASEEELNTSYQSGSLYRCEPPYRTLRREEIFLDVNPPRGAENEDYKTLPGGTYLCVNHRYHDYDTATGSMLHFIRQRKLHPLLFAEQEAFLDFIGYAHPMASLQVLLKEDEVPPDLKFVDDF